MPRIRPVRNLREYFRQSVAAALERNDVAVDEHTSCYVVNLLTLYARSEALFEEGENGPELKPLALLLAESVDRGHAERNLALQRIGDQSLFIAGFLGESLNTRLVDVDYYVCMGGSAYATLSRSRLRSVRDRALGQVFAELAQKFLEFVDVLTELREEARTGEEDLLRLYEVWTRTGSRRAERLLRSRGIEPQRELRELRELREQRKPH
jgi:hypothetical protein